MSLETWSHSWNRIHPHPPAPFPLWSNITTMPSKFKRAEKIARIASRWNLKYDIYEGGGARKELWWNLQIEKRHVCMRTCFLPSRGQYINESCCWIEKPKQAHFLWPKWQTWTVKTVWPESTKSITMHLKLKIIISLMSFPLSLFLAFSSQILIRPWRSRSTPVTAPCSYNFLSIGP